MNFKKATKVQSKARIAIYGPSGSGKTYSSLRIANGMSDKIALIDSERGSASKYADRFAFDVLDLEAKDINEYCNAIACAADNGYEVLIIDSLTHAWQELLQEIDRLANTKFKGNTWSAWSEGTPKQRRMIDAILAFPGHIIATMRSKTEWAQEEGKNGKSRPVRVGLAPEQGKGIEYEFDILMSITPDHQSYVEKDRSGRFQDQTFDRPGEEFGKQLVEWLNDGDPPKEIPDSEVEKYAGVIEGADNGRLEKAEKWVSTNKEKLTEEQFDRLSNALGKRKRELEASAA